MKIDIENRTAVIEQNDTLGYNIGDSLIIIGSTTSGCNGLFTVVSSE